MALVLSVAFATMGTSVARAHPKLDRAVSLAAEAEFGRALRNFEAALASGELTRDELVVLLTERALVNFAMGSHPQVRSDLNYLSLLAPDTELGERAPPRLTVVWQKAVARVQQPLGLSVTAQGVPGGLKVTADVQGDPQPDDLRVRVAVRSPGGDWQTLMSREARYPASDGSELEFYAELIGMGGVVLARQGSPDAPQSQVVQLSDAGGLADARHTEGTAPSDGDGNRKWWWIGGGGAVALVAAVALGVALSSRSSDQTRVEAPAVDL